MELYINEISRNGKDKDGGYCFINHRTGSNNKNWRGEYTADTIIRNFRFNEVSILFSSIKDLRYTFQVIVDDEDITDDIFYDLVKELDGIFQPKEYRTTNSTSVDYPEQTRAARKFLEDHGVEVL